MSRRGKTEEQGELCPCVFGSKEHKLSPTIWIWFIAESLSCWRLLAFTHATISQNKGRGARQCWSTCVTWQLYLPHSVSLKNFCNTWPLEPKLFILLYFHKLEAICIEKKRKPEKWLYFIQQQKIHNPTETKWTLFQVLCDSPHALSPHTRSKCAVAEVESTLFWHNYGPILFRLPLEKSSWALRLISMICIEEWFMTSFGLEMQGRDLRSFEIYLF